MNIIKRIVVNSIANSNCLPTKIRHKLYNFTGIKLSESVEVRSRCFFNSEFVIIGENSFVNCFTQFHSGYDKNATIEIGESCFVGMNVNFCVISHEIGDNTRRAGKNLYKPIKVGNGSWIGANALILPGVKIGEGCIVAAGSVVNKDCESNSLYAGNPAKKIKELSLATLKTA